MSRSFSWSILGALMGALLVLAGVSAPSARAQSTSAGTVVVTVVDQSGGVVAGTQLQLQDLSTNDIRNGVTRDKGTYSFVNLSVGTYKLTVSKSSFSTQVYDTIVVQAAQVTDLSVTLKVAAAAGEKVEVTESATPLVDTTSNAISTTIDMKQIEDLPLAGRNVSSLSQLVPGFNGTWNGLPVIAQTNNIDGVIANTTRMKFGGDTSPEVSPRIEDIQEMTVETDQMNSNTGMGQAPMEVDFVTRRGTNSYHGRAFEDFQNSYMDANSWANDAAGIPRGHQELNEFGGSLGGPILKNKLFFFGSFEEYKSPNTATLSNTVLSSTAEQGVFPYANGVGGTSGTICLFTATCPGGGTGLVDAYNAANPGANLPTWPGVSSEMNSEMAAADAAVKNATTIIPNQSEPDFPTAEWTEPGALTNYYPTVRVDYNMSQNFRVNFAWNMTKTPPTPYAYGSLPGLDNGGDYFTKNYTAALGFDWTISPALINSFRGGFLYNATIYANSGNFSPDSTPTAPGSTAPQVFWAIGTGPQTYSLSSGSYYPVFNFSDTTTWQHGAHTVNFGLSWWREQDHYYNGPSGVQYQYLGINSDDPANNIFQVGAPGIPGGAINYLGDLASLYADLEGRVAGVGTYQGNAVNLATGQYYNTVKSYSLDELMGGWGLFAQDSYRLKPNLTVNYSLRWDLTSDDHDLTGAYHGITSTNDLFGPSGPTGLFNPGVLAGNPLGGTFAAQGHQYKPWHVAPQPQVGIAWSPQFSDGFLGKLTGGASNTVVRAGFGIRYFTEAQQYFWDAATNYGSFYFQGIGLSGCTSCYGGGGANSVGYFPSGGLTLQPGFSIAPYSENFVPATYQVSATQESVNGYVPGAPGLNGLNPNVAQPYVQEWNLGIQRQLGRNNAIEISYHGNRSNHQWVTLDTNEVNVFGNYGGTTFLQQFQQAQQNLRLNNANATAFPAYNGTFAYNSAVGGESATPVFDAAFAGESAIAGTTAPVDYNYGSFITDLNRGAVGSMANALTQAGGGHGGANFFCNLVGQSFYPCGTTLGYVGAGAGYPINYFQADPYYSGQSSGYMTSGGTSTYNGLQVDFRQKAWHGMQFDANYTWSKSLGVAGLNGNWTATASELTLRDLALAYQPTNFDYHHVIHMNGTYDLPFGKGRSYLNHNGLVDRVVGGWTLGTIVTYQTGAPFTLGGGYDTYNDYAAGGVVLNGITRQQLQDAVGVYPVNLQAYQTANGCTTCAPTYVGYLSPSIIQGSTLEGGLLNHAAGGNTAAAYGNIAAGTLIPPIYLYGPHRWSANAAVTKVVPIRENLRFSLQGEFLNVFNHPVFGVGSTSVDSSGFGTVGGPGGTFGRTIELRANLEF